MYIHNFEDSTLTAPNHSPRCTNGTKIDSGYGSSTKLGNTVAGTNSSSQECVLEQPDPDHSDMLHTTKTKHVQSAVTTVYRNLYPRMFTRNYKIRSYLCTHSDKGPFVCTICGETFAHRRKRNYHEGLHSSEKTFFCRGELSAQPARAWGCGLQFASVEALARHFFSQGNVGRACIIPLLDNEGEKAGVLTLPSVLLTQYPGLKNLDLAHLSAWQKAPIGGDSGLSSNDSGYESALHSDRSKPLYNSFVQVGTQTEGPQMAPPHYGSLSSLESQVMPSSPSPNLQDSTDNPTLLSDRPETSEDSDNSLVNTILSGDEPNYECFSSGIELSGHQIDSKGTSDSESERRSSYKARHVSKKPTFVQEKACGKDANAHLSGNSKGSLSPDESSSISGFENGYNDSNEESVLNCSKRSLISRLMDEIRSSFSYQVSHRPRKRE